MTDSVVKLKPGKEISFAVSQSAKISPLLFNRVWYNACHNLEFKSDGEALNHFLEKGFEMRLNPAPLVDLNFIEQVGKAYGWKISGAIDLFATLESIRSDSPVGWSARVTPIWLSLQLNIPPEELRTLNFVDLLSGGCSIKHLSPHPGLKSQAVMSEWSTLSDAVLALTSEDFLSSNSLVDLQEYVRQHRDLKTTLPHNVLIFDHMWSEGLAQNRMKYLGTVAPRWMTHDQLVRAAVCCLIKNAIIPKIIEGPRAHPSLPKAPLRPFTDNLSTLSDCLWFDPKAQTDPPSYAQLSVLSPYAAQAHHLIVETPEPLSPLPVSPSISRKSEILDVDLLSGTVSDNSSRVVYSINLGLYDYTPLAPEVDDCAYYLITDAMDLPDGTPWRIVRPTISERDRKRLCLWFKTHPHLLFPNAQHVVWMDSNVECLPGSENVLCAQETLAEVSTFAHPDRSCIYQEAEEIVRLGLDDAATIKTCVDRLKECGMPANGGLFETNVLYSKPQDYAVRRFFDCWWRNIFLGSRRDQMSFTLAAFLTGVDVSPLDGRNSTKSSRFFRKRPHRQAEGRRL